MSEDQEIYEEEIGLAPGPTGRTLIEEDARELPWPTRPNPNTGPFRVDFRATCLYGWHDLTFSATVESLDREILFGPIHRRFTVRQWVDWRTRDNVRVPGHCSRCHRSVAFGPRTVTIRKGEVG